MLISHKEVLYEAKKNEVTKIFAKMPNQAYMVVREGLIWGEELVLKLPREPGRG